MPPYSAASRRPSAPRLRRGFARLRRARPRPGLRAAAEGRRIERLGAHGASGLARFVRWWFVLRIYDDALAMVREVGVYRKVIERSDRDHARQLRRASKGVVLGLAEGAYSRKGNRKVRYHEALGSARETLACLELAVADGIVDALDDAVVDRLDKIICTIVRLTR